MASAGKLKRQRERIRALVDAEPSRSSRSIALEVGCGVNTVIRARNGMVRETVEGGTGNGKVAAAHPGGENLVEPAGPGNSRAVSHGAWSEGLVAPRRERLLGELRVEFPGASERRLIVQAHRLAQLELLGEFADERGVIRSRRTGDVFPAAQLAERIASAFLSEQDRLEAQRDAKGGDRPRQTLAEIEAELAGDVFEDVAPDGGGGGDG